ncbi:MAG: hypothetical protein IPM18_10310 [Phycisphaerales bacterium]|nr:hypothetical protein [Phycisphaerales bacterium]
MLLRTHLSVRIKFQPTANRPARPHRSAFALVATSLTLFAAGAQTAQARNNIRDAFFSVYPNAVGSAIDTVPSRPVHCGVCHYSFSGGGARNPYGLRVEAALPNFANNPNGRRQAIFSVQEIDADLDGYTTVVEVTSTAYPNTPTFPGLSLVNIQQVSAVEITEIMGSLTPSSGDDTTPPDVTVLAPAGGEVLSGNAAFEVQWTATDLGGIARVDLFLSDDGGANFRPIAAGLTNSGSQVIFVPNRPTTQGLVRVVATDNTLNVGTADSPQPFTVVSPPGGTVPTTLRDFDLPGTQPLEVAPLNHPDNCVACHGNYAPTVEPYRNWRGSMMAMASHDPLFLACMSIANQDAPDSGDLCLRCHIPGGWLGGRSIPTNGHAMLFSDMHGVSCDLCHRLVDPVYVPGQSPAVDAEILANLGAVPTSFGNGMFVVDPEPSRRGPFVDAALGHEIIVSPFHRRAALCGTCHDVSNSAFHRTSNHTWDPNVFDTPPVEVSPEVLMPIERTYSEWLHSDYNTPTGVYAPQFGGNRSFVAACQDCHMRAVTGKGCNFPAAQTRNDLPLHDMTGGSTWMASVLPVLYPTDPQVDAAALADGVVRARYMLQNAARLEAVQVGRTLQVTVTNDSGHKLPTGYPEGRRVWLSVRFRDAALNTVGESGVYDLDTATLLADAELKVYECKPGLDETVAALAGTTPGPSFHFVLNNRIYKDNRIPPRGFTNAAYATFGGSPVGATYADGQHWDVTPYGIPDSAATAEVMLYYQSTTREYIEFLRDHNVTTDAGSTLYNLWLNHGQSPPELMVTMTVALVPLDPSDLNGDGIVDFADVEFLIACFAGPDHTVPGPCLYADLDGDEDTDLGDMALLQVAYSPSNQ